MNIFKLALYGDSLACPRQGIVASHERYIALLDLHLRKKGYEYIEIRDNAQGGATLPNLNKQYLEDNTYFEVPGNVLIIHAGIVDCAPRPVSDKTRNRISKLPGFVRKGVINYIHKNRRKLILAGQQFVKTEKGVFKEALDRFLTDAITNYDQVFLINICPTTPEIDHRSPGFSDSINLYNCVIADAIKEIGSPKIFLVDIHKRILEDKDNLESYIVKEDGHHIHPKTHRIIADQIINKLV